MTTIPDDFKYLCRSFYQGVSEVYSSTDELVRDAVATLNESQQQSRPRLSRRIDERKIHRRAIVVHLGRCRSAHSHHHWRSGRVGAVSRNDKSGDQFVEVIEGAVGGLWPKSARSNGAASAAPLSSQWTSSARRRATARWASARNIRRISRASPPDRPRAGSGRAATGTAAAISSRSRRARSPMARRTAASTQTQVVTTTAHASGRRLISPRGPPCPRSSPPSSSAAISPISRCSSGRAPPPTFALRALARARRLHTAARRLRARARALQPPLWERMNESFRYHLRIARSAARRASRRGSSRNRVQDLRARLERLRETPRGGGPAAIARDAGESLMAASVQTRHACRRRAARDEARRSALAAIGADGVFEGYASLFDVRDTCGDIVAPGAFAASLRRSGAAGVQDAVAASARRADRRLDRDRRGCARAEGARAARSLGRAGARSAVADPRRRARWSVDRLSHLRAASDPKTGARRLLEIDLVEISIVTFPALPQARIGAALPSVAPRFAAEEFGRKLARLRMQSAAQELDRSLRRASFALDRR